MRRCKQCGNEFPTLESLVDPASVSVGNNADLRPAPRRAPPVTYAYMNPQVEDGLLPDALAAKVKDWWLIARRLKHGRKAVWSERAWRQSLNRVVALNRANPAKADYLVERGLEMGWQALDPQFVENDKAYQAIPPPGTPGERRPLTNPGRVVTAADAMRDWPDQPTAPQALPWGVNRTDPQTPVVGVHPSAKSFEQDFPAEAARAKKQIANLFKIP